jgi:hypothetical protein
MNYNGSETSASVTVVETGSEMNGLLVLSNAGELHSYIDCLNATNVLNLVKISCTGENVLHLLFETIDVWCC